MGKIILAFLVSFIAVNMTYAADTGTSSGSTYSGSGEYPGSMDKTQQEKDAMKKKRTTQSDSKSEKSDANTNTDTTKSKTAPSANPSSGGSGY